MEEESNREDSSLKLSSPKCKNGHHQNWTGGDCMLGGIYTQEKCPSCDTNFKDNGFDALACPKTTQTIKQSALGSILGALTSDLITMSGQPSFFMG
jgi:hypothetical protein